MIPEAASLARAIARTDYLRGSPAPFDGPRGFKEWLHFCVHGPGFDLLVNFSLVDDARPGASPRVRAARLIVLYREEGAGGDEPWDGGLDRYDEDEVRAPGGRVGLEFGESGVRFQGGAYHIRVRLRDRPVELDAALVPVVLPAPRFNVGVGDGPPIHWVVVPRLLASGELVTRGRRYRFQDAPAYHDHNFGHFRWGRDFAWEWGFGLPPDPSHPMCAVFVRLSDRGHALARAQALFLWKGPRQHRVFRDGDLRVRPEGLLRPERMFKLPRPLALLSPGLATDVPRRLVLEAEADGDEASGSFEGEDVAQVIIPNDDDLGVTIIHEVKGLFSVRGTVRGEDFRWQGRAVFEFLGS